MSRTDLHILMQDATLLFQGVANMTELYSWLSTQADKVSQLFVYVLTHRFNFTHNYIPFMLFLFENILNKVERWCFEMIWFLY